MSRIAIVLIVLCSLAGLAFFVWKDSDDRSTAIEALKLVKAEEARLNKTGAVVYAIKDIKEGDVIAADALEQRELAQSKIPESAITHPALAIGKKARFGISQGQIVMNSELALP